MFIPIMILKATSNNLNTCWTTRVAYVNHIANLLKLVKGDNLLEIVEQSVACSRVRKECNSRWAGPWYNWCEDDANQDGTTDTIHHENKSKESVELNSEISEIMKIESTPSNKDSKPHCGASQNAMSAIVWEGVADKIWWSISNGRIPRNEHLTFR